MTSALPRWSKAELQYLEEMTGDLPFSDVVRKFQYHAKCKKWPKRSAKAILQRVYRSGRLARGWCGQWTTTGGTALILGCPAERIEAWLRKDRVTQLLEPRTIKGVRHISRKSWRRLAREMPEQLGGYSVDQLFTLLEDRELAEAVATRYPRTRGDWRVRCVETGTIWPSAGHAAREMHVSQAAITLAIREKRPVRCLGMSFQALRDEP